MAGEKFRIERGPVVTIRHLKTIGGAITAGDLVRAGDAVGIALETVRGRNVTVNLCLSAPLVSRPNVHTDNTTVVAGTAVSVPGNGIGFEYGKKANTTDRTVPGVVAIVYETYDKDSEREKLVWGPM